MAYILPMGILTFDKLAYLESLKETVATKSDLRELELRITIKFGSMLLVAVGVILGAMRFIIGGT